MTIGPFTVGERPSEPLLITVHDAQGQPINLAEFQSVAIEGFPAGVTTIANAPNGQVQYTFTEPFSEPGVVEYRVVLVQADGDIDHTPWGEVVILGVPATSFVTSSEAWTITGSAVSRTDLAKAQSLIGLIIHRELGDATWRNGISRRDLSLLRQAIAWQAAHEMAETTEIAIPGATRVDTGDVSVTYGQVGISNEQALLAPLALIAIQRLSWNRKGMLRVKPFLAKPVRTPNDLVNDGVDAEWQPI